MVNHNKSAQFASKPTSKLNPFQILKSINFTEVKNRIFCSFAGSIEKINPERFWDEVPMGIVTDEGIEY
jgi:hypothetical protein